MTIVSSTVLRNNLADTLNLLQKKDVVLVRRRGQIKSALIDIDLLEDLMALKDKKYLKSIVEARKEYQTGKFKDFEDVFGQ